MVEEFLRMGIQDLELGHGLRVSQIEGILRVVDRGDIRIHSLHNFCPHPLEIPTDSPDCYEFTSHRESDRRRAIQLTRQTIQLAEKVGAHTIVLHGGRARTLKVQRECLGALKDGSFLTKSFGRRKVAFVQARETAGSVLLERLREALQELLPVADEAGVQLALENRERYEDVPSEREMLGFLDSFSSPNLGYWHDFGHAQIKENLGFLDHHRWVASAAGHLQGCHIHDVLWPNDDHLPPFSGEIAFSRLMPLIPSGTAMVFELSPYVEASQLLDSWQRWKTNFPS